MVSKWMNRAKLATFVICDFVSVAVNVGVVVAVVAADVVVKDANGNRHGAIATDVVTDVEADGPLDNWSTAAVAASEVSIVSTLFNMNERTNTR